MLATTSFLFSCNSETKTVESTSVDTAKEKTQISSMLDSFNRAAAKADFNAYFNFYTDDAIFTGTDATERWNKTAFMAWAKPIFEKAVPGILQPWNGISILIKPVPLPGLMNC